jgi:hypothetical protein
MSRLALRSVFSVSTLALVGACASSTPVAGPGTTGDDTSSRGMSATMPGDKTADIEVRVVDAPNDDVAEIVVTLDRVDVRMAGQGWSTLVRANETIDLLKLQGGNFRTLGITTMPAGHIEQFRLYVNDAGTNYVRTSDGQSHPLTVPSGDEAGIKVSADIDWEPCAGGYVTLDFDGKKSLSAHPRKEGSGEEWILRPVLRLKAAVSVGTCDAGAPLVPVVTDPCATMTCPATSICWNGYCKPLPPPP